MYPKLENLSLRNQHVPSLYLTYEDLRDVKRLYVSGGSSVAVSYAVGIRADPHARM